MKSLPCVTALFLGLLLSVLAVTGSARAEFFLKPGDRVVFFGDSITQQMLYTRDIEDYVRARYPGLDVRFFNAGWNGDTTTGGLARLERDVLGLQPTVVTLFFGMNDGRYVAPDASLTSTFHDKLEAIIKALQERNVRVVVFTPGCVDDDKRPPLRGVDYNRTLEGLGAVALDLARQYGCPGADIHQPMLAAQTACKARQPGFTMIPDGIHPNEEGHLVIAGLMLQALGAEPMPALADDDAGKFFQGGKAAAGSVYTTAARPPVNLPLWMPANATGAIRTAGLLSFLGQTLKVRHLPPGTYEVKIGNRPAGLFGSEELAAGVAVPGTYSTRAQRLYELTGWKDQNYYNAWRTLRLGPDQGAPVDDAVAALMKIDELYETAAASLSASLPALEITVQATGLPDNIGPNLALKKSYVASDPNTHGFGVGALTDGSWESADRVHVFATGETDAFPKTVTIDLGKVSPVNHVLLGVPPYGSTETIQVSVSADGKTFKEVGAYGFRLHQEERHLYSFAVTPARYVRLTYPDHFADAVEFPPTFVFTSEVEVYGPAR